MSRTSDARRRLRFRLQWRAIAVLTVVWMIMWGEASLINLIVGLLVGWLVTVLFPLAPIHYAGRLRPWGVVKLLAATLWDLIRSSVALSLQALGRHPGSRPGVLRVELSTRSDLYEVATAELVSIVPGTLVIEARRSVRHLYLHVFDLPDGDAVEAARARALQVERHVVEALGSAEEIARIREEPS